MTQTKAKFYPETELIIPIDVKPSLTALDDPAKRHPTKGTDEHGDWVLVDFIHDKSTFFDYTVENVKDEEGNVLGNTVKRKRIEESEWDQM